MPTKKKEDRRYRWVDDQGKRRSIKIAKPAVAPPGGAAMVRKIRRAFARVERHKTKSKRGVPVSVEHNFSFEITVNGHPVGLIEDGTAFLEIDRASGDWYIRDIQLSGSTLPEGHYLYQPVMTFLTTGEERKAVEKTWAWRKTEAA